MSDDLVRALEAVRPMAAEYGLASGTVKPCIAVVLDGTFSVHRHDAAFVLAIEFRKLGFDEKQVARMLGRWAKSIGYKRSTSPIRSAILGAFAKKPNGEWRYHPPGVRKKEGSVYDRVLGETCRMVGCPANCGPYRGLHVGERGSGFAEFEKLDWPARFRKGRKGAAIDWYRAICEFERLNGFTPGAPLVVSFAVLSALAGRAKTHARENLRHLYHEGLLEKLDLGSGSGPKARDRRPTQLKRRVPIPPLPPPPRTGAISTGNDSAPSIGNRAEPSMGTESSPDIGDRSPSESEGAG